MIRALFLAAFLAAPASADVPVRLEAAFVRWAEDVGADKAVMSIWRAGLHHTDVTAGMDADTPVELASLSKAVTALCAATLIKEGVWTARTTSQQVLDYGPKGIGVGALMTHTSGIGPDQTQLAMQLWLDRDKDRAEQASKQALNRAKQSASRGSYSYNNENYAILGTMIAAQTGQTYATFCERKVLQAAGVSKARLSPRTGSMAAWGGWQMTVGDYARLMHWAYGPDGLIGKNPQDWPQIVLGGGASYGVGMIQRPSGDAMNYWHFGLLCFPARLNAGSFAVRWADEWSVVAAYNTCVTQDEMLALDATLSKAVFQ